MSRILIVDDNMQIRLLFMMSLTRAGYQADIAKDGNQACKMYRENPYDLVITDIVMPEKEGTETIIELRRDFPDVKIFAISGGGDCFGPDCILKVAENSGAIKTFPKPVDLTELKTAIENEIGKPRLGQQQK